MTEQAPAAAAFFEALRKGNDLAVDTALAGHEELIHARDAAGLSPVLAAAFAGHTKLATHMSALAARSAEGLDFFDAAAVGNVTVVRSMLTADRASVDDRGPDGYTALHLAAAFGQLEVARLLLGRGADPNAVTLNDARVTPLHSAVNARHRDTASLLLALGASPRPCTSPRATATKPSWTCS
jgi:ankyrin repeat protein